MADLAPLLNTTKYVYYSGETGGRPGDLKSESVFAAGGSLMSRRTYQYDSNGNKVQEVHEGAVTAENRVTVYEYDSQNRLLKTIQNPGPGERITHQTYNAFGKVHEQFDPLNHRTRFFYDARGNLVQTVHYGDQNTQPTVTRTVYDSQNRVVYSQERCYTGVAGDLPDTISTGIATHNIYDVLGRVARTERLSEVKISSSYDGEICQTKFEGFPPPDPNPEAPPPNHFISATDTEFDAAGRVFRTTSQGVTTESGYDAAGRRVRSSVWNQRERIDSFYGHDENGNVRFFTNALGVVTGYEYDELNRAIVTTSDAGPGRLNIKSFVGYDTLGHKIAETNETDLPGGIVVTRFGYDAIGRLIGVTNAYGTAEEIHTTYGYNRFGELTSQTNAENHVTRFSYNQFGQRIRRTLPNDQYEEFFYDVAGNKTIHTNFTPGLVTEFHYDALNRLTNKFERGHQGGRFSQFVYNATGQRLIVTNKYDNAETRTVYGYDAFERLATRTLQFPQEADSTLSYAYDERGQLKEIAGPEYNVKYAWDALNRLETVSDQNQRTTRYTYDIVGNLKTVQSSTVAVPDASLQTTYNYDHVNRLQTMQVVGGLTADPQPLASFAYDLGRTRKRKGVVETFNAGTRTVGYTYDLLDRLTVEDISEGWASAIISYRANGSFLGYDKLGNRRSREVTGDLPMADMTQFENQGFDVNDRLTTSSYDANGNTTIESLPAPATSPTAPDEYDFENRLIKRTGGNRIIEIIYDGDGNRVRKKVTEGVVTTITYLVDDLNPTGYSQVLREHIVSSSFGTATALYCYGHDLISQQRTGGDTTFRWYGYDGHGSVRFLVGEDSATITDAYNYDAFGILIAGSANTANDYLYAGERFDPHLGLYYNRARYLNPSTGRFWSMDPSEGCCGQPISQQKYLYAHADPVNGVDPTGLWYELADLAVREVVKSAPLALRTVRAVGVLPVPGPIGGYGNDNTQPAWPNPLVATMYETSGDQRQQACRKLAMSRPNQNQYFYTQTSWNRATGAAAVLWHKQAGEEPKVDPPGYRAAFANRPLSVHRGHLIPQVYGGNGNYENIVTQEAGFNLGPFRHALEYEVDDMLAEGHGYVCVLVRPVYAGRGATGVRDPGNPVPSAFGIAIITAISHQFGGYIQPRIYGNWKHDIEPWNAYNTGVVSLNY